MAEIARDTGISSQTIDNWRSQWQKQGQLVPATNRPPQQWSASDKLAAVIQTAGLSGRVRESASQPPGSDASSPLEPVLLPVPPMLRPPHAEEALTLRTMEFSAAVDEPRVQSFDFGHWLAEALNHAFGNPREEALHQPPLVGVQPYRDRPRRRGIR